MGLIEGFDATWNNARATFGEGAPKGGESLDQSSAFRQMQAQVESARPGGTWSGSAADQYSAANEKQARVLGELANLDQRTRAEVDRAANVVTAGRRDLDSIKQWVHSAAASVPNPNSARGQQMLMPIVRKGAGDVAEVIQRANSEQNAIAGRLNVIKAGYQALGGDLKQETGTNLKDGGGPQTLTSPDDLPLYGPDGKPRPGDVMQRDIGDCYFEAAEIAVADKDPNRLKGMIVAGPDGKYYVSGMQDVLGNPIHDYPITQKDLQVVLSPHKDQKVLWPVILEAAAAKTRGGGDVAHGLELMGGGDYPGTGLQQLTGHASYNWFPGGGSDENDVINALNSGKPVVMGTSISATPIGVDPHRDGLAAAHVYAISSAHRDPDGTVWAEVINPWQSNVAQGDSGPPVVRTDPSTPGRMWINLSNALSHHGVTAFVEGG